MYLVANHYLQRADGTRVAYLPTPNVGPGAITPELIVIHYTGDTSADGAIAWLRDPRSKASAHLVVDRDGTVTQLAAFSQRCWHAGQGEWNGRNHPNNYSLGIELVNAGIVYPAGDGWATYRGKPLATDDAVSATHKREVEPRMWQVFPAVQIEAAKVICRALVAAYPLITAIAGHDDVAPYRKVDPGPAFPMKELRTSVGL